MGTILGASGLVLTLALSWLPLQGAKGEPGEKGMAGSVGARGLAGLKASPAPDPVMHHTPLAVPECGRVPGSLALGLQVLAQDLCADWGLAWGRQAAARAPGQPGVVTLKGSPQAVFPTG